MPPRCNSSATCGQGSHRNASAMCLSVSTAATEASKASVLTSMARGDTKEPCARAACMSSRLRYLRHTVQSGTHCLWSLSPARLRCICPA